MQKLLVALLLVTTALAGCADSEPADDPVVDDFRDDFENQQGTDSTPDDTSQPDDESDDEPEVAPEDRAILHVTLLADSLTGVAPATISFTVNATSSAEDGGAIQAINTTWAIFSQDEAVGFQESGTDLPGAASFTFDAAGEYTIIAGVDADNADEAFANITITIQPAGTIVEEAPPVEKWWVYYPADGGCGDRYMTLTHSPGQEGGCGNLLGPANYVLGPAGDPFWNAFPADGNSVGFDTGTEYSFSIAGHFGAGVTATFNWELLADGAVVASGDEAALEPMVPFAVSPGFSGSGTLDSAIPSGSLLTFQYYLYGPPYWEGPAEESYFLLGAE